jgi:hypothetical protein
VEEWRSVQRLTVATGQHEIEQVRLCL